MTFFQSVRSHLVCFHPGASAKPQVKDDSDAAWTKNVGEHREDLRSDGAVRRLQRPQPEAPASETQVARDRPEDEDTAPTLDVIEQPCDGAWRMGSEHAPHHARPSRRGSLPRGRFHVEIGPQNSATPPPAVPLPPPPAPLGPS